MGALLAQRLGCPVILDEWDPASGVVPGALHLTNADLSGILPGQAPATSQPFDIDRACAAALAWLNSSINRSAGQHLRALRSAGRPAGGKGGAA